MQKFSTMFWIPLQKGNAFSGHYLVPKRPPSSLHSISIVIIMTYHFWLTFIFHFDLLVLLISFALPLLCQQQSYAWIVFLFSSPMLSTGRASIPNSWHYHGVTVISVCPTMKTNLCADFGRLSSLSKNNQPIKLYIHIHVCISYIGNKQFSQYACFNFIVTIFCFSEIQSVS